MKTIKVIYSYSDDLPCIKIFSYDKKGLRECDNFLIELKTDYLAHAYFKYLPELKKAKDKEDYNTAYSLPFNSALRHKIKKLEYERDKYLLINNIKKPAPLKVTVEII